MWLVWTNPTHDALVVDTTVWNCDGGPVNTDLAAVLVYGWPSFGGLERLVYVKAGLEGRQGLADSAWVDDTGGWWFNVAAVDESGNVACRSNRVFSGTPAAGVPVDERPPPDPIVVVRMYNVAGQLVRPGRRLALGVYVIVSTHKSGRKDYTKRVLP